MPEWLVAVLWLFAFVSGWTFCYCRMVRLNATLNQAMKEDRFPCAYCGNPEMAILMDGEWRVYPCVACMGKANAEGYQEGRAAMQFEKEADS